MDAKKNLDDLYLLSIMWAAGLGCLYPDPALAKMILSAAVGATTMYVKGKS